MLSFIEYINESVSKSSKKWFASNTIEGRFDEQTPKFTPDEMSEHIVKHIPWNIRDKAASSNHDPKAPIGKMPESVKAYGRALMYHFEEGIRKKGKAIAAAKKAGRKNENNHLPDYIEGNKHIYSAANAMKNHIGEHYRNLLVDNKTRGILKELFTRKEEY